MRSDLQDGVTTSDGGNVGILEIYNIGVLLFFVLSLLFFIFFGFGSLLDPMFLMDIGISCVIAVFWFITVPVLIVSFMMDRYENWKHGRSLR